MNLLFRLSGDLGSWEVLCQISIKKLLIVFECTYMFTLNTRRFQQISTAAGNKYRKMFQRTKFNNKKRQKGSRFVD